MTIQFIPSNLAEAKQLLGAVESLGIPVQGAAASVDTVPAKPSGKVKNETAAHVPAPVAEATAPVATNTEAPRISAAHSAVKEITVEDIKEAGFAAVKANKAAFLKLLADHQYKNVSSIPKDKYSEILPLIREIANAVEA